MVNRIRRPGGAAHFSLGRFSNTKEMNRTFNTSVISQSKETGESGLRATPASSQRKVKDGPQEDSCFEAPQMKDRLSW